MKAPFPWFGGKRRVADVVWAALGDVDNYVEPFAGSLACLRVCCGDWSRVVTNGALNYGATVGVFLDPPYLGDVRTSDLYATDDHTIAHEVRQWCLDNGDNPRYRIVLAGYSAEHDHLIPATWRRHSWSGTGGYAGTDTVGSVNRHGETLWMSPGCLSGEPDAQGDLFGGAV